MPRIPPENVRPTGSAAPPENAPPIVEIPEEEEEEVSGFLPPGFQRLTSGGVIDPAVGTTLIDSSSNTVSTLADGTEDGQIKLVFVPVTHLGSRTTTVRCNFYHRNNNNYAAINRAFVLRGKGAWALLRWTEGIPTTSGAHDLWKIVGGSDYREEQPPVPSTALFGYGKATESGGAVNVQIYPPVPGEFGAELTTFGVNVPFDAILRNARLRAMTSEDLTSVQLSFEVEGATTNVNLSNINQAQGEVSVFESLGTDGISVQEGNELKVFLSATAPTGAVVEASLGFAMENALVQVDNERAYMTLDLGTVPSGS